KISIKEFKGKKENALYLVVALNEIKKSEIVGMTKAIKDGQANVPTSLNIRLSDLLKKSILWTQTFYSISQTTFC
ncbi:MAG: hypothetical protein K5767_00875, partial [Clostridia bacterium]|nr:hypothetical protein [Clostridia bacterium]